MPKPTFESERRILNPKSAFAEKKLCDGPTFTAGDACKYSCSFCYVPSLRIATKEIPPSLTHSEVIVRRKNPEKILREQLTNQRGIPRYHDPKDTRVVFASPLVDVAADMDMARETIALCRIILELTHWQIRLLSKSNLLPEIAKGLGEENSAQKRVIYGVSTGTLDNKIAQAIECGTPLVSKRIESLHWLQDHGFRTYGMICPSLPTRDPKGFSKAVCNAIGMEQCEHVWAEVINVRGESLTQTIKRLRSAGFETEAADLLKVSGDKKAWEQYNRETFLGHAETIPPQKLRYLAYTTKETRAWWESQIPAGAIPL